MDLGFNFAALAQDMPQMAKTPCVTRPAPGAPRPLSAANWGWSRFSRSHVLPVNCLVGGCTLKVGRMSVDGGGEINGGLGRSRWNSSLSSGAFWRNRKPGS